MRLRDKQKPGPGRSSIFGLCVVVALLATATVVQGQLGNRSAEDWISVLERERRVQGLRVEEVVARLDLNSGDVVVDIGAGSGAFSGPLAVAVEPAGTLLAVDIEQGLLDYIDRRAQALGINNLQTVLGKFEDPNLPRRDVDLAFFHDVLHHIEHREPYLRALNSYLKPKARLVVIDLVKGHPNAPHRNRPEMQITPEEIEGWVKPFGFRLTQQIDLFESKFFLVFSREP